MGQQSSESILRHRVVQLEREVIQLAAMVHKLQQELHELKQEKEQPIVEIKDNTIILGCPP